MRAKQASVLETLRQAQRFLDAHADILGEINASPARRILDAVVVALATFALKQDGSARSSRGETKRQRSLRKTLRSMHMRPIAAIARQKLPHGPEFDALKMPGSRSSSTLLVAKAGGMADAAESHKDLLVENGLPQDFLDKLRSAANALASSVDGRSTHVNNRIGSSAGLAAEERRGRMVLEVLDPQVQQKLGEDDPLLAEWRSVIRIPRKPGPAAGTLAATTQPKPAAGTGAGQVGSATGAKAGSTAGTPASSTVGTTTGSAVGGTTGSTAASTAGSAAAPVVKPAA